MEGHKEYLASPVILDYASWSRDELLNERNRLLCEIQVRSHNEEMLRLVCNALLEKESAQEKDGDSSCDWVFEDVSTPPNMRPVPLPMDEYMRRVDKACGDKAEVVKELLLKRVEKSE